MHCHPIKMLICWLLLTSPSVQGDVPKPAIFVQNVVQITSKRPLLLSGLTYRPPHFRETSTVPTDTSADYANESYVTASHGQSYDSIPAPPSSFDNDTSHQSLSNVSAFWGRTFTSEDYESMTYGVNIVTVLVGLLGVLFNLVTIRVYMRMPRSVTSTFFRLVTGMDVLYLLAGLPSTLMHLWLKDQKDVLQDFFYVGYSIYVSVYFAGTLRKVIVCVTMMLSVDRVLLVAFPIRTKTHTHLRRPKLYTLVVAAMAYLLDSHILFRDRVSKVLSYNATEDQVGLEDTYESQAMFVDIYLVSSVLFQYIPLALLVIANVLLVLTLVRHSRQMEKKLSHRVENDAERSSNGGSDSSFKTTAVATISYNCESRERISNNTYENMNKAELERGTSEDRVGGRLTTDRPKRDEGQGAKEGEGRQGRKARSSWGGNKRRKALAKCEKQHSVMVLIYSFFFTLLALPSALFPLFRKLIPGFYEFGEHHFLLLSLYSLFFLLNSLSSSMNFLICFLTGSAFRQGVSALCGKAAVHRSTLTGLRSG